MTAKKCVICAASWRNGDGGRGLRTLLGPSHESRSAACPAVTPAVWPAIASAVSPRSTKPSDIWIRFSWPSREADLGVDHDRALGRDDDRIQVELGDLRHGVCG